MKKTCVLGLDFGTASVRGIIVDTADGECLAEATVEYPGYKRGDFCDPSKQQFRQYPADYLDCLEKVCREIVGPYKDSIAALSLDTTGSTPCLVDKNFTPLGLTEDFKDDPDAMFIMWKDHTSDAEAREITALCQSSEVNYAKNCGGDYSPENFWSKILHIFKTNPRAANAAWGAVECCDWIPAVLTGCKSLSELKAGHCICDLKHMHSAEWGGYPPEGFMKKLDPRLVEFSFHLPRKHYFCSEKAGVLTKEWAERLGLNEGIAVGVGNVDSYSGAVGAGIKYRKLVMNMGTSACYMAVMPEETFPDKIIPGVFGQIPDGIIPGYIGFEAGLSAFGDVFSWFRSLVSWPLEEGRELIGEEKVKALENKLLSKLDKAASELPFRDDAAIATDYLNGRRSPSPDTSLTGTIMGLRLSSSAPEIYRALVEATAFASKAVIDNYMNNGIEIGELMGIGGISLKSPFVMKMMADTLGMEISVAANSNSCAIGAAVHAAVLAGIYPDVASARDAIAQKAVKTWKPDPQMHRVLMRRYLRYRKIAGLEQAQ